MARSIPFTNVQSGHTGSGNNFASNFQGTNTELNNIIPNPKPADVPTTSSSSGSSGPTAAERAAAAKAKKRARAKAAADAAAKAKANLYNPMLTSFKSPAQIRKEAEDLAIAGSASEQSLRDANLAQQTGITGLTTGLSNRLQGLSNDYQTGVSGLGAVYNTISQNAQDLGGAALAAGGATSSTLVPGKDNALGVQMAAFGAVPGVAAAAAEQQGAQMRYASTADLTKQLAARSNQVSSDTAKYIRDLQGQEYNKAIAQITSDQNNARLNLDANYKAGMLGVAQTNAQTKIGQLARQAAKDAKAGKASASIIKSVQKGLLSDPNALTEPVSSTTDYTWTFAVGNAGEVAKGVGPNRDAAIQNAIASGSMDQSVVTQNQGNAGWGTQGDPVSVIPKRDVVHSQVMKLLVNAGMSVKKANAWISAFLPNIAKLPN